MSDVNGIPIDSAAEKEAERLKAEADTKAKAETVVDSKPPITVIWSGGFDSTAVIIKYLEEGREVRVVSVSLSNNPNQARAEKDARRNITKLLSDEFPNKLIPSEDIVWPEVTCSIGGLSQPPIWLYVAAMHASTTEVAFGWVKEADDIWHYRECIFRLPSAIDAFTGKTTTILIPFEWITKKELIDYYVKRPHVFHQISTSELGMPWSLGNDEKCKEMQELAELLKKRIEVKTP